MEWEHRIGLGLFTPIILVYVLWRTRRQALGRALGFLCMAVILLASVYRGHLSPWALVFHWVPGASAIRAISRIGIFLLFPAAYALSLFIEEAQKHRFRLALFAIAVLALVEQGRTPLFYEKIPFRRNAESLARLIDPTRCSAFFFSPRNLDTRVDYLHLDAVWAYLTSGVPTLNGYSGNTPPHWDLEEARILTPADETRLAAALSDWETRHGLNSDSVCWIK